MTPEQLSTHQKALRINLDPRRYGTFAEIGAGQEVVRWFFRVGAAAGTISKSMSAYDMTVSDAIYGPCERYVCRQRLQSMLDYEHTLNLSRLRESRGDSTAFFTFADTVSARGYRSKSESHGWMGIKYQSHPRDEDSQIILHVRMLDNESTLQQEALGIVGVNLLYGAFFHYHQPEQLLEGLMDGLSSERIEIDMIEFSGIEFRYVDNRVMALKLVEMGLSKAAMFSASGEVLQPAEVFHKHPVLVERGSFRPVTRVHVDMIQSAAEQFALEPDVSGHEVVSIMEITMHNLMDRGAVDLNDFLARADALAACGHTVLISDFSEYFRLADYLHYFARAPIGIAMSAQSLQELFDPHYYEELPGGLLEAFGHLFKRGLRLYIYPFMDPNSGELLTVETMEVSDSVRHLFRHLVESQQIKPLDNYNAECLNIFSRDILDRLKRRDDRWESMVPPEVAAVIKEHNYFGYRPSQTSC